MKSVLNGQDLQCRVSSVLNKDVTQYGKMYMFDDQEDTCWCSENDSPQWVAVQWKEPSLVSSFQIQFQGGFVGKDCEIVLTQSDDIKIKEPFYPEDNNSLQSFTLKSQFLIKQAMFKFNASTDFFGRVIIYKLDVFM